MEKLSSTLHSPLPSNVGRVNTFATESMPPAERNQVIILVMYVSLVWHDFFSYLKQINFALDAKREHILHDYGHGFLSEVHIYICK